MTDSFASELRDLIDRVYIANHGGRATQGMVHNDVWAALPEHMADYLIGKGIRAEVTTYFRAKTIDGLPRFPEVNAMGEHVQLELLSVAEFGFVHASYVKRSDQNLAQADKIRQRCIAVHGVEPAAVSA